MLWSKNKRLYADDEILEGFKSTDYKVLKYVYFTFYPVTESFVLKNGGRDEDAKDIFQEGLSAILIKITKEDLKLNCSFGTFLFSICRNLWLNEFRKRRYNPVFLIGDDDSFHNADIDLDEEEILFMKKEKLFRKHFSTLDEICKKLIAFHLNKISSKEIAEKLGFKDEMQAIRRKAKCKDSLIRRIKNDPDYYELI